MKLETGNWHWQIPLGLGWGGLGWGYFHLVSPSLAQSRYRVSISISRSDASQSQVHLLVLGVIRSSPNPDCIAKSVYVPVTDNLYRYTNCKVMALAPGSSIILQCTTHSESEVQKLKGYKNNW
ncbi:hypothetical protein DFH27DRAFT_528582 [Peziza echinospora]|nr:hypothetical protein DFH27DRAFT_528582 [Peziza echinospora]